MKQETRPPQPARRDRRIVAPTFGAHLLALRGKRSRGGMCQQLEAFGLSLDRSTLLQYERGTVGSPDPAILWGLGRLYHVSLDDLVLTLMRDRTGRPIVARDVRPPALDEEQLRMANCVGQVMDESTRRALLVVAEALAERPAAKRGPRAAPPKIAKLRKRA